MKYVKNIVFYLSMVLGCITLCIPASLHSLGNFQVTDQDREELRSMGFSDEEIEQTVQELSQMSPEQEQELLKTMEALEQEFQEQGIDPTNREDLEKFTQDLFDKDKESQPELAPVEKPEDTAQTSQPSDEKKKPSAPAKSLQETARMLQNILSNINSIKQKASRNPELSHSFNRFKQEINELVYYLNVLNTEDLLKYVADPQQDTLYKALERLNKNLQEYEPLLNPVDYESLDEIDDPYQELNIRYTASQKDIDDAYERIKKTYGPDAVKEQLTNKNAPDHIIQKRVNQAYLSFAPIQDAYERLKNPAERAVTDKELKNSIQSAQGSDMRSMQVMGAITQTLNNALFGEQILENTKGVLKKYEPEALARKKEAEKQEKSALDILKKDARKRAPRLQVAKPKEKPAAPGFSKRGSPRYGSRPRSRSARRQPSRPGAPSGKKGNKPGSKDKKKDGKKEDKKGTKKSKDKDKTKAPAPQSKMSKNEAQTSYNLSVMHKALSNLDEYVNKNDIKKYAQEIVNIIKPLQNDDSQEISEDNKKRAASIGKETDKLNAIAQEIEKSNINIDTIKKDDVLKDRLSILAQSYAPTLNKLNKMVSSDAIKKLNQASNDLQTHLPAGSGVLEAINRIGNIAKNVDGIRKLAQQTHADKKTVSSLKKDADALSRIEVDAYTLSQGKNQDDIDKIVRNFKTYMQGRGGSDESESFAEKASRAKQMSQKLKDLKADSLKKNKTLSAWLSRIHNEYYKIIAEEYENIESQLGYQKNVRKFKNPKLLRKHYTSYTKRKPQGTDDIEGNIGHFKDAHKKLDELYKYISS
jgi:curved DNA-binding protein CbpA